MSLISRMIKTYLKMFFCLFCSWIIISLIGGFVQYVISGYGHQMISPFSYYGAYLILLFGTGFSLMAAIILTLATEIWQLTFRSYIHYGAIFSFLAVLFSITQGARELKNYGFFSHNFLVEELIPKIGLMFGLYVAFMFINRLLVRASHKHLPDGNDLLDNKL